MILAAIFLIVFGLLMIFKPQWVWTILESWKSSGAEGPSDFYVRAMRFGGILCTLAGVAASAAYFLA